MPATHDHEEPASLEFAAALEFEPCADLDEPPSSDEWRRCENPYLITARMAYVVCKKTKPELVEMIGKGDVETAEQIMDRISDAKEFFQYFHDLLERAEARMLSAGAVVALSEEDEQ